MHLESTLAVHPSLRSSSKAPESPLGTPTRQSPYQSPVQTALPSKDSSPVSPYLQSTIRRQRSLDSLEREAAPVATAKSKPRAGCESAELRPTRSSAQDTQGSPDMQHRQKAGQLVTGVRRIVRTPNKDRSDANHRDSHKTEKPPESPPGPRVVQCRSRLNGNNSSSEDEAADRRFYITKSKQPSTAAKEVTDHPEASQRKPRIQNRERSFSSEWEAIEAEQEREAEAHSKALKAAKARSSAALEAHRKGTWQAS